MIVDRKPDFNAHRFMGQLQKLQNSVSVFVDLNLPNVTNNNEKKKCFMVKIRGLYSVFDRGRAEISLKFSKIYCSNFHTTLSIYKYKSPPPADLFLNYFTFFSISACLHITKLKLCHH